MLVALDARPVSVPRKLAVGSAILLEGLGAPVHTRVPSAAAWVATAAPAVALLLPPTRDDAPAGTRAPVGRRSSVGALSRARYCSARRKQGAPSHSDQVEHVRGTSESALRDSPEHAFCARWKVRAPLLVHAVLTGGDHGYYALGARETFKRRSHS